jgi:coenzyme F420 hydrogenase subunit beta
MINKILKNNLCTGCGLCQSIYGTEKITVELDNSGFYRPKIHTKLSRKEEKQLENICPGVSVRKERTLTPFVDSIWGEMYSCIIGASTDKEIVNKASSGGAITSILTYLLDTKTIDAVIHIGASENEPYRNEVKISLSKTDVIKHANSRYSPSAPLIDIISDLKKYENYAFVGKPCDVAALKQYARINAEIDKKIKYYISFFCAGVPSLNATLAAIEAMDIKTENIKKVDYRKDGWPGFFRLIENNGKVHKLSYSLTWMKLLGPYVQFRCKLCADGVGHLSDIVCADAWDDFDKKGFPTFKNAPGRSLIISRTEKGNNLINEVLENQYIQKTKLINNFREIDKIQPGQLSKKVTFVSRSFALLLKKKIRIKFNRDFYIKAFYKQHLFDFIKNFYGTFKRIT